MINLTPIAAQIQRRLFEKMRVLGRDQTEQIGSANKQNRKDPDGTLTHAKLATRSTFLRMCSGQTNPVVLSGGKLKDNNNIPGGYDEIYGSRTYHTPTIDGELISAEDMQDIGYYYTEKRTFENKNKRPMPGLKSADITFKGGVRALREATVQWTCWDWEELNILMPHFLAHGKTVLLEWGWAYDGGQEENFKSFILYDKVGVPYIGASAFDTGYIEKVIDQNGDFDMMVGIIKNFEFTTREDGGFDCTTIITSVGASILNNPEPNEVALDPGIVYNTSVNDSTKEVAAKISNATGPKGTKKGKRAEKQDDLVDLDTTLSLKLFIKEIDRYIFEKFKPRFGEGKSIYVEPNKYMVAFGSPNGDVKISTVGIESYDGFGPAKGNTNLGGYWVRWGWFEDNVLSKFLSMVTKPNKSVDSYPEVMTEFRSIEQIRTPEGKPSGEYESVLIKNHSELQTTDINNHIMPGQFYPVSSKPYVIEPKEGTNEKRQEGVVKGDVGYLLELAKIVNDTNNFSSFSKGSDTISITEKIYKDVEIMKLDRGSILTKKDNKMVGTGKYQKVDTGKTQETERPVPGKYGYLRNMLINTKTIKEAFGVGDEFTVESINVVEALESLFSIINRELNFWNFSVVTDEEETQRAKIIDNQVTAIEFDKNRPVTNKQSFMFGEDVVTDEGFEPGIFFFPVWQKDSMVKRQNITAKIPDAMQLAVMYGTNMDQLKDFGNPGAAFGEKEGVFIGALFNENTDTINNNMDIAFRSDKPNLGTPNGDANEKLSNKGDDIRKFITENSTTLEQKLEDRLDEINKQLNIAEDEDLYKELNFDESTPPPVLRDLTPEDLGELLRYEQRAWRKDELGKLFGGMFDSGGNMKSVFKRSVGFLTTQHGIYKNSKTPLLIPLDLELEIDGIGGIFPGNSCHSTYVPAKYQDKTVFQIFDVNHRVGNEGWTVTLACKMRSNLDSILSGFETLPALKQKQINNYLKKAVNNEIRRQKEIDDLYKSQIGVGTGVTPGRGRPVK